MQFFNSSMGAALVLALGCGAVFAQSQQSATDVKPAYPVHVGEFPCADKVKVSIQHDPKMPNRYMLHMGKSQYPMHAVDTSTGVVRLEDPKQGLVWLQLGNKSMLMNSKLGRRMADECMSSEQVAVAQSLKNRPAQDLFTPVTVTVR